MPQSPSYISSISSAPLFSEILGMLAFSRLQGKGTLPHRHAHLEAQREISLPLSAEALGWIQQDSQES